MTIPETIIGRGPEIEALRRALASDEAELVAVYGRRRVGKTFLVRNTYREELIFGLSGVPNASMKEQLEHFSIAMGKALNLPSAIAPLANWTAAFDLLTRYAEPLVARKKCVIFFDEFPWLASPKSRFLQAFDYFWNSWAAHQPNLVVVICGSAASWMIRNVVHDRGGLHNRITNTIHLSPFTLAEVEAYLRSRRIRMNRYQITQLYMAFGGIPYYLRHVERGESMVQAINRLCFGAKAPLREEFRKLYHSLFADADKHIDIVRALASKANSMGRQELIKRAKLQSGGTTTRVLEELVESGFVTKYLPFQKRSRDVIYKLSDEYSRFYLKFIEGNRSTGVNTWAQVSAGPSWGSWSGNAFESVCLKHIPEIKEALGIAGVYTEESAWRHVARGDDGCQIDLLLDRQDSCISVCEMKFSEHQFVIDKAYAKSLEKKLAVFQEKTETKKALFLVMVTTFGVKDNDYKINLVSNEVVLDDLFVPRRG